MKSRPLPSKQELDELVKYNPDTGEFFWRMRPVSMFDGHGTVGLLRSATGPRSAQWSCNQWNSRHAGNPAASLKKDGYVYCCFNYGRWLAHRVAWKIMTGEDPNEVDHIDGNRSNNKWSNLRNGTRSDNLRNIALKRNNTSGHHGVHFSKQRQQWTVTIGVGSFDSKEEAIAARKRAEEMLGYHPNHGRDFVIRRRPDELDMPVRNKSGTIGVSWVSSKECWQANISVNKQHHFLGYFKAKDEAIAARKAAEEEYFGLEED